MSTHAAVGAVAFGPHTLDLIEAAVACAVDILNLDEQLRGLRQAIEDREALAERRYADIQALGTSLSDALARRQRDTDTDLSALADRIRQSAGEEVAREVRRVRDALERDCDDDRGDITRLENACRQRTERLLLRHDLPGASGKLSLVLTDVGEYDGHLRVHNDTGLGGTFELDCADDDMFDTALRVGDVVSGLKVHVPHRGRVLRRDGVSRRKLDGMWLTCLVHTGAGTLLRLRKNLVSETGYDIRFVYADDCVRIAAAGEEGVSSLPEHSSDAEDVAALAELEAILVEAAEETSRNRRRIHAPTLGDAPLDEASPTQVATQIIHAIALTVQELASASGSRDSLVVRDASGQTLRLQRDRLLTHIRGLPQRAQALFYPLGLTSPPRPAPSPPRRRPRATPPTPPPQAMRKRRSLSEVDADWDRPSTATPT